MTTPERQQRFEALLTENKRILYKVCHSYCRNRDDREDLAQEIIIQLWLAFGRFDDRCRFSTWMYRVALNVAISFLRKETTRARYGFRMTSRFWSQPMKRKVSKKTYDSSTALST